MFHCLKGTLTACPKLSLKMSWWWSPGWYVNFFYSLEIFCICVLSVCCQRGEKRSVLANSNKYNTDELKSCRSLPNFPRWLTHWQFCQQIMRSLHHVSRQFPHEPLSCLPVTAHCEKKNLYWSFGALQRSVYSFHELKHYIANFLKVLARNT